METVPSSIEIIAMPEEQGNSQSSQSTSDWIFIELWQQIVRGDLPSGVRLTEEGLSEALEVSRTPLREAIRRLEEAHLLVRHRKRTLRVAQLSINEMIEMSMTRESLEGMMARQTTLRVSQQGTSLEPLEHLLHEMEKLKTDEQVNQLLRLGDDFHRQIWDMSGNRWARRVLQQLLLSFERYRHLVERDPERSRQLVLEHAEIFESIKSGDSLAAEFEMRSHISSARRAYLRGLEYKLSS